VLQPAAIASILKTAVFVHYLDNTSSPISLVNVPIWRFLSSCSREKNETRYAP
jgi:hypothetical protein